MTFGLIDIDSRHNQIWTCRPVGMTIFTLKKTLTFDLDLQIIKKYHKCTYWPWFDGNRLQDYQIRAIMRRDMPFLDLSLAIGGHLGNANKKVPLGEI